MSECVNGRMIVQNRGLSQLTLVVPPTPTDASALEAAVHVSANNSKNQVNYIEIMPYSTVFKRNKHTASVCE